MYITPTLVWSWRETRMTSEERRTLGGEIDQLQAKARGGFKFGQKVFLPGEWVWDQYKVCSWLKWYWQNLFNNLFLKVALQRHQDRPSGQITNCATEILRALGSDRAAILCPTCTRYDNEVSQIPGRVES